MTLPQVSSPPSNSSSKSQAGFTAGSASTNSSSDGDEEPAEVGQLLMISLCRRCRDNQEGGWRLKPGRDRRRRPLPCLPPFGKSRPQSQGKTRDIRGSARSGATDSRLTGKQQIVISYHFKQIDRHVLLLSALLATGTRLHPFAEPALLGKTHLVEHLPDLIQRTDGGSHRIKGQRVHGGLWALLQD